MPGGPKLECPCLRLLRGAIDRDEGRSRRGEGPRDLLSDLARSPDAGHDNDLPVESHACSLPDEGTSMAVPDHSGKSAVR
jgi:hypothetical protein